MPPDSPERRARKQSVEQLNEKLVEYIRDREPGPILTTLINYLVTSKYNGAAAREMCFTLGEDLMLGNVDSLELRENAEAREKRKAYGITELASTLIEIGASEKDATGVIEALTKELDKCGIEEAARLRRLLDANKP